MSELNSKVGFDYNYYSMAIKVSSYDGVIAGIKSQDYSKIVSGLQNNLGQKYNLNYNSEKEQIEWSKKIK
ncbi:hypothetical protein CO037_02320 [Candidatus Pacearchaeota archaeon CG_4_9_14_0_2_um_filter_30_8]|nr:MAG: hypothetical protein CO037_02320 [Candidatus Pacearchaeota archaeon CG_4_9_14_0_2_um_filter_30_8]